ncbi:hypothetical protein [Verminephrobacter eiseniae]|uniref:hypothetical protein n=1 Tax=Verminephrobacter eiseniae TaxID=364317 RepID=UPI002237BE09|nr:hypothetical protein [Verminephrobacter eiseniae]MCW5238019.1 hypothetical protein [Verminephrobacter eiseniae]
MLELGAGADILRAIGWLYIGFVAALLWACLWFPRRWWQKIVWAVAVLLVSLVPTYWRQSEESRIVDARKARYEKGKALFDERCKTAGAKVYKTVEDVEGVLLQEVWPSSSESDLHDPKWPNAGLPRQYGGNDYIESFIMWEHQSRPPKRGYLNTENRGTHDWYKSLSGYAFVDVKEDDGFVYRYRLNPQVLQGLNIMLKNRLSDAMARYAISFRSITANPADREQWVAGMTVLITDTKNSEVIAEKTWYSFERGFGDKSGWRSPWLFAITCPASAEEGSPDYAIRLFVDQVLKSKQEN